MSLSDFEQHIRSGERVHLVGIGGISMSPLAEILYSMGVNVSGSDNSDGSGIERLRSLGIDVTIGHFAQTINGAGCVIRTAAAREDNIEIQAARDLGIPVFERAQAWGFIMRGYKNAICIAGVHGKTTTTSMVTHILLAADADPTIMIGGSLPILGSGYRLGGGDVIALESCEYYNSYHSFFPTVAVILNVDADHLDFFKDVNDVKDSFAKFASLVPDNGFIVCNGDDENTMDALTPMGRDLMTFGFGEDARIQGRNVKPQGRQPSMDVYVDGEFFCEIRLRIPGMHNLKNALAAAAACICVGISAAAITEGLHSYMGVGRRFELKGHVNGADIYDDYAHHPSELKALLDAVSTLGYKRVILAFQPHTFSRTKALFTDFVEELSRPDLTYVTPIYAARERDDITISSEVLADAIPGASCVPSLDALAEQLRLIASKDDIILTVGAGDIYKVCDMLVLGPGGSK